MNTLHTGYEHHMSVMCESYEKEEVHRKSCETKIHLKKKKVL